MKIRFLRLTLLMSLTLFTHCSDRDSESIARRSDAALLNWMGNGACMPCHRAYYDRYMETGMGRSLARLDADSMSHLVRFNQVVYDTLNGFYYAAFVRKRRLLMREWRLKKNKVVYEQEREATYQVGSSNHTISFLEDQGGYLFEMPLTWYSRKQLWDLSPGYRPSNWRFERPVSSTCLNCHTAPARLSPETENHYASIRQGIGCENCHGAGKDHVALASRDKANRKGIRESIKNPRDWDRSRQMDVCQRCHLEGLSVWNDGIEPHMVEAGRPLSDYKAVFVTTESSDAEQEFNIAAQADRLKMSRCYEESSMTCTTCHDAHKTSSAKQKAVFNAICSSCHGKSQGQSMCTFAHEGTTMENQCISCHMNVGETSDIPHVSFTDHYIRKKIDRLPPLRPDTRKLPGLIQVIGSGRPEVRLQQRGLAYYEYYQTENPRQEYLDSIIVLLESASEKGARRNDGIDHLALGFAYFQKGRYERAVEILTNGRKLNPSNARISLLLGNAYLGLGEAQRATVAFKEGMNAQPLFIENYLGRARAQIALREYNEAIETLAESLLKDSVSFSESYFLLGQAHHNLRDLPSARSAYEKALRMDPDHEMALLNLAGSYLQDLQWAEAIRVYDRLLEKHPQHVQALLNKAICQVNARTLNAARRTINLVLSIDPWNETARQIQRDLSRMY